MDNVLFSLTGNNILSLAALLAAIFALIKYFKKGVNWVDGMNSMDRKIEKVEMKHDADMKGIREEQTVIVYGILACLKAIDRQGSDPAVQDAINKIEKHLNSEAHK